MGLAVAIAIFYVATVVLPDRTGLMEDVSVEKDTLLKYRDNLGQEDIYKKRLEQANADLAEIKTRLLPGDNAGIAGTELMKVLVDFAMENGVEIMNKSNQAEKKVQEGDTLTKVSVRIETNCELEQLIDFLIDIENYDKFLKVEELNIIARNINVNPRRVETQPSLTTSLVIAGYIDAEAPKPAETLAAGAGRTISVTGR